MQAVVQPFLHELVSCVRAPTAVLSGRDGQIREEGAHGLFHADTRFLAELLVTIDGCEPSPIAHRPIDGSRARFAAVVVGIGDPIADPTVRLVRDRTAGATGMTERIDVVNDSRRPIRVTLAVRACADMAPIGDVKHGRVAACVVPTPSDAAVVWETAGARAEMRWTPGGSEPVVAGIDGHATVTWRLDIQSRSNAVVELDIAVSDRRAAGGFASVRSPWAAPPSVSSAHPDLGPLVQRSLDDLAALALGDPMAPGDAFAAAGCPWFLTLFGRDSLWTARFALPVTTDLAGGTLRTLARRQAELDDVATAAERGKILHEVRASHVTAGLTPLYYGSVDATPLWISLLHDAWCWGLPDRDVADLLDPLERALGWMLRHTENGGFLTYRDESGRGLANQGWKDSGDSIQYANGTIASAPITLCEVQGYAHRAALDSARLLDAFDRPGSSAAREYAELLATRFRHEFWVEHPDGRFPALALDAAGDKVDSLTSNIGHLLTSGLLDPDECALVARRLADDCLSSGYGLRTLASDHPNFNPLGYHTGSVWPHDTTIAIDGLARTGHGGVAGQLAHGLLDAAHHFGYRLPELFGGWSSDEGPPLAYPASCHPQAWAAASALVLLRVALGLDVDVPAGSLTVRPEPAMAFVFPLEVRGLRVGGHRLDVAVDARGRADVTTDAPLNLHSS